MTPDDSPLFPSGLSVRLDSSDADEMREQSVFWLYEHKQYTRGLFKGHLLAGHTRNIQLSLSYRSLGVLMQGDIPRSATVISIPLSLDHGLIFQGQPLAEHQAIALTSNKTLDLHNNRESLLLTIVINSSLLEKQAQILCECSIAQLQSQSRLFFKPLSHQYRTEHLKTLLFTLINRATPLTDQEEKSIEDDIIATILTGVSSPTKISSPKDRLNLANRAREYILSNLSQNISIIDLCASIGTSERNLHLGFKERFGVGPKSFMQIMRLNAAHQTLRTTTIPIAEIAFSCGFNHLGRFSEQYHRMFNELPSITKKKQF